MQDQKNVRRGGRKRYVPKQNALQLFLLAPAGSELSALTQPVLVSSKVLAVSRDSPEGPHFQHHYSASAGEGDEYSDELGIRGRGK